MPPVGRDSSSASSISSGSARPRGASIAAALALFLLVASSGVGASSASRGGVAFPSEHLPRSKAPPGLWHAARSKAPVVPPPDGDMGGPSVNPSHGHHHDAPGASPSGKPVRKPTGGEEQHGDAAPTAKDAADAAAAIASATEVGKAQAADSGNGGVRKREDYISWDDYFMGVAFLSAMRSKDPSTQVGACLVDEENKIVGIGYNGFPRGCSDDELPWARHGEGGFLDTKYAYVCHAEMNAILNRNIAPLQGCRMYVALFPCNECAKLIIQSGVRDVIYVSDKYHDDEIMVASRRLFDLAGVRYRQHTPKLNQITIDFTKAS